MQLVELTIIKKNHPNYKSLDALAFLSKNLYNIANYIVRQEFIEVAVSSQRSAISFPGCIMGVWDPH